MKRQHHLLPMESQHNIAKYTIIYIIDVFCAVFTYWDVLDHTLRTIAALGVLVSTVYLILKHRSEHQVNMEKKKLIETEHQIKQQELYRAMQENKDHDQKSA